MSSSGSKRPREEAADGGLPYEGSSRVVTSPAPKKARDWRDAFLDEPNPRTRVDARDHHHHHHRRRSSPERHRHHANAPYHRRDDRSRDRDSRSHRDDRTRGVAGGRVTHDDARGPSRYSDGGARPPAERNGGGASYRRDSFGPSSRSMGRPREGEHAEAVPPVEDHEEGEIVSPPPKPPRSLDGSDDKRRSTSAQPAPPAPPIISKPPATTPEPPTNPPAETATSVTFNATDEPEDLEAKLEERRRKRRELMERLAGTQSGVTSTAASSVAGVQSVMSNGVAQSEATTPGGIRAATSNLHLMSAAGTPTTRLTPAADEAFDLTKGNERSADGAVAASDVLPQATQARELDGEQQISAADYNPNEDRKHDHERLQRLHAQQQASSTIEPSQTEIADGLGEPGPDIVNVDADESEYEEVEVDDDDEDFDMFSMDEPKKKKTIRRKKEKISTAGGAVAPLIAPVPVIPALQVSHLVDNYDDAEGYYRITPGELLDSARYQVTTNLGKGMFSAVVKAKVIKAVDADEVLGQEVAIKVIRSQESMYVAGRKEAQILAKLAAADPTDKKHIVRLLRTFEHRGHLCLVTESLSMNLRDVVKRFGKDVGLNLRAVRAYAHQMFLALSLMKKCNIIHADIKPDNILVTESKAVLKVCDLGSACEATPDGGEITPYLVSRFYRAPEIILGLPYDEELDVWAVGCTLFELYTGKILFPGRSNNQMLHLMMDLKGKFNHRMIKKSKFGELHFDEGMNFRSVEKDKITGQDVTKTVIISKPSRDLKSRLLPPSSVQMKMKDDELKLITDFVDLVDKCLVLDPAKRLTCREALLHPFLGGGGTAA